jgi:hypothetical protein
MGKMVTQANFVENLEQFALSIDIVDETTKRELNNVLSTFFKAQGVTYFEVSVDGKRAGKQPALGSIWTNGEEVTWPIEEGYATYAYTHSMPLWVTATSRGPLKSAAVGEYQDQWSGATDLPPFWDFAKEKDIRTSIAVPLLADFKTIGLLVLEFEEFYESSENAKRDLRRIANSLGEILQAYRLGSRQRVNSGVAVKNLGASATATPHWKLVEKPGLFVAFSDRGDQQVVGCIKNVLGLEKYASFFDVKKWDEVTETGNVNQQILRDLSNSAFGILYLSEKADAGSDVGYTDNPNVVFEAGILHGQNDPMKSPTRWLPIREEDSPPMPFDFGNERMIIVPRGVDRALNVQSFEARLSNFLDEWVNNTANS